LAEVNRSINLNFIAVAVALRQRNFHQRFIQQYQALAMLPAHVKPETEVL
jgi:hypothetical protein